MTIDYFIADTSGNITLFVLTPVKPADYAAIATFLMEHTDDGVEQVAFIKEADFTGTDGSMDMCGMEFCCNASRAFGLYLLQEAKSAPGSSIRIQTSGMDEILKVSSWDNKMGGTITLPPPVLEKPFSTLWHGQEITVYPASMDGIMHYALMDIPYEEGLADEVLKFALQNSDHPAIGVLFCDTNDMSMIPAVHVRDVNTTFLEGSCGSGTAALAAILHSDLSIPGPEYRIKQPAGILTSAVETGKDGLIKSVTVSGPVVFTEKKTIQSVTG